MIPDFRLEADGRDITELLRDRLLSLDVTDEAGSKSDSLSIALDDRQQRVPLPPRGAALKVWLGYRSPHLLPVYMGAFKLDEVELSSGPRSMTISAKAADFSGGIRAPKTRSFHDTTLGAIVRQIGAENGLAPAVLPGLAALPIAHIDQTEESDVGFLTRLAERYGAVVKPADGRLVVVQRGAGLTASGAAAPVVTLTPQDVKSWKLRLSERGKFGAVEASWQDHAAAQRQPVRVGDAAAGPVWRDRTLYPNADEARRAASAQLDRGDSGKKALDIELPGRPTLFAEAQLQLSGFRPEVDGLYSLKSVKHSLSGSGYATSLSAEAGNADKDKGAGEDDSAGSDSGDADDGNDDG